mmetsp:Transcript_24050/g.69326  ORF Transcript_24050/g.69326 Transcript_24050/m.69326 type:complete len:302 (-) Transcript_24050:114-1019(-)
MARPGHHCDPFGHVDEARDRHRLDVACEVLEQPLHQLRGARERRVELQQPQLVVCPHVWQAGVDEVDERGVGEEGHSAPHRRVGEVVQQTAEPRRLTHVLHRLALVLRDGAQRRPHEGHRKSRVRLRVGGHRLLDHPPQMTTRGGGGGDGGNEGVHSSVESVEEESVQVHLEGHRQQIRQLRHLQRTHAMERAQQPITQRAPAPPSARVVGPQQLQAPDERVEVAVLECAQLPHQLGHQILERLVLGDLVDGRPHMYPPQLLEGLYRLVWPLQTPPVGAEDALHLLNRPHAAALVQGRSRE